jgi:hypothetical protein
MKIIIADIYTFYVVNSKNTKFPKEYKSYKIIWNMRDALIELWGGRVTEVALPKLGLPGYDFLEFINNMEKIGQIKKKPKIKYYDLEIST